VKQDVPKDLMLSQELSSVTVEGLRLRLRLRLRLSLKESEKGTVTASGKGRVISDLVQKRGFCFCSRERVRAT